MIEQMFDYWYPGVLGRWVQIPAPTAKHNRRVWRLKAMRQQIPSLLAATARTAAMVVLAMLLILVILPAMLAAQAAGIG
jgi:hypothetical protein